MGVFHCKKSIAIGRGKCGNSLINGTGMASLMYQLSHRLFALGLSSAIAFFLDMNIMMLPVVLPLAYMIGSFPDIDLRLNITHRGVTHHFMFFLLMTLACTFGIFYLYYFLQVFVGIPIFGIDVTMYGAFPLPTFFQKIGTGNFSALGGDTFLALLVFFFVSFTSHFMLDMITPSGLDVAENYHVSGVAKSSSAFFNFFFGAIGIITTLVAVMMILLRYFHFATISWTTWFFAIDGAIILITFILLIAMKGKADTRELKCFKLDKIDICIPTGKCFKIGPGKDDKICNIPEGEL